MRTAALRACRLLGSAALPATCLVLGARVAAAQDTPRSDDDARAVERCAGELRRGVGPAVVAVAATTSGAVGVGLRFPGLVIAPRRTRAQRVEGTGFLVSRGGHVATTSELLRHGAVLEVRFADGTVRDATVVGYDEPTRLAILLTAAPEGVAPIDVSSAGRAREAETVGWLFAAPSAAGAPRMHVISVVPAPERSAEYDRYLYAPTELPSGAAGGPLLGCDGRILGMAVGALVQRDRGCAPTVRLGAPCASLFVRGDDVAGTAGAILRDGAVRRPMLGVLLDHRTNRVAALFPDGPAERAGIAEGDVVFAIDTTTVQAARDVTRALFRRSRGDRVRVHVRRGETMLTREVELEHVESPPPPSTPPLQGAMLRVEEPALGDGDSDSDSNASAGGEDATDRPAEAAAREPVVTFESVEPTSRLARAGVRAGDRLVSVDGRGALVFLSRHSIRPGAALPARIVVARDGDELELSLED